MVNVEIKVRPFRETDEEGVCLFLHDGVGCSSVKLFLDAWNEEAARGEAEGDFTMFVCPEHYREVYEWAMDRDRQTMIGELTKR